MFINSISIFSAMFNINAQHSILVCKEDTLNELETFTTSLGSLQLIETNSVDNVLAGLGRNIYFPPDIS